ncbi:ATPase family AAA domain-containing protein 5-like isoform X2 [Gadus macrocephalus]|uniref:ATPase family AAA domain-containing protein 5-like isoform X2 n=1 Tax=Gadus macrocephalus TaxID=80720 RepID=UPI0028CBB0D5|nr:ATPase family AAA domain-containing protein 5-like isoform X2 [Gadus macrocephalus]
MAGVVAMAAVIEDFEIRRKKPHKDGDSPGAKTITNYFPPVPKNADKQCSPSRSSNIMDYFSRKPPSSSKETCSPLEQSKENCRRLQSIEKQAGVTQLPGKPSQKQTKRKSKVARKLQKNEAVNSSVDESGETMGELVSGCLSPSMLRSDIGALLDQPCAESLTVDKVSGKTNALSDGPTQKVGSHNGCFKSGKPGKTKPKSKDINGLSPVVPLKDKAKPQRHPAGNPRRKKTKEEKATPAGPAAKEADQSLVDVSMEVNVDEYSRLNDSTVTVSFEDFLQSQNQGDGAEEVGDKGEAMSEVEELDTGGQLEVALTKENIETSHQNISPRTLTFQAEVHAVLIEPVKSAKRLASIFTKRKEADISLSPPAPTEHFPPPPPTTLPPKRKSNVVLQEDDLELAVLESASTPKCSQAERKQFMAAFKRPGPDRAKPGKIQAKQKQPTETAAEAEVEEEEATVEPPDTPPDALADVKENTLAKKKTAAKGNRKASKKKKKEVTPSSLITPEEGPEAALERTGATATAAGACDASMLPVRRSKREALPRQAAEAEGEAQVRSSRRKIKGQMVDLPQEGPLQMSTPKSRHRSKSMYKAHLICPHDKRGSPIRIKFTKIQRISSKGQTDLEINSPLASKTPVASKKKTRAKRLVERAKVIKRQSKKTAMLAEENTSVRRSSRSQAISSKVYVEDEDSLVYIEDAQATQSVSDRPPKKKSKQRLRSLNDVLGKATAQDSKVAPLFQDRKSGRTSAVGSIFDEGSREGSENSLDDEACRARRQFLKSGLPDSFKKLIVKTEATMEAYALSCSSFHPVVHVLQTPQDCPLSTLPWPASSFLHSVKDSWRRPSSPIPSHEGPLQLTTASAPRTLCDRGTGQRPELSDQVRQLLKEEIISSNPSFPAQRFLTHFLKRRDHHLQQTTATGTMPGHLPVPFGGKRKRVTEVETSGKQAKKQRSVRTEEEEQHTIPTPKPEHPKRGGRGRGGRAQRCKLQEAEQELKSQTALETASTPAPSQEGSVIVLDDSPLAGSDGKEDGMKEELLWTEKYQPQNSSDIIGNTASVRKLHGWLKEWKLRTDREEGKKQKDSRPEEISNDSDWGGEDPSQDQEDMLCNTLLITGPTGVGKTAAVYACAQELGFKVFEVNSSSQRSGRLILSQLKEATQSHQVDIQGVNAHKPTYFNSYSSSISSPTGYTRPGSSPRKVNSPRRVVSSPSKQPQSPRGAKRGSLAPTSLASFFKMGRPRGSKEAPVANKATQRTAAPDESMKPADGSSKLKEPLKTPLAARGAGGGGKESSSSHDEQNKKTATSLILFEEVDVIFDEDHGFLAAIKTFMTTTKRPVILTTSDPHFSTIFDGHLEEIHFTTPSMVNVSSYLRLLCLTEDTRTDAQDVSTLLSLNNCDIRQSLLQLQFWTCSTGRRHRAKQSDQLDGIELRIKEPACVSSLGGSGPPDLPLWDTGCAESMLGLVNVQPQGSVQDRLKKEPAACWELVADCRRRRVDLLYSNMHTLLPLPVTQLPVTPLLTPSQPRPGPTALSGTSARQRFEAPTLPSKALKPAQLVDALNDGSPVKVSQRMRKHKRLAKKDPLHSDSEDDFLSLAAPAVTAPCEAEAVCASGALDPLQPPQRRRNEPLTPQQRAVSGPVSHGLAAIADFLDDMSFMDACSPTGGVGGGRGRGPCVAQRPAQVKDGMVDEARLEDPGPGSREAEQAMEIQAAVESMSFQRCRAGLTEAQGESQALGGGELGEQAGLELSLPVADHQRGFSLTPHPPCQPKLLQKCMELLLLSRGVFSSLGSRPELSLEYLPTLRTICRAEQLKEQGKVKRRFLHYLDLIHLGLSRDTLQHLAGDFP